MSRILEQPSLLILVGAIGFLQLPQMLQKPGFGLQLREQRLSGSLLNGSAVSCQSSEGRKLGSPVVQRHSGTGGRNVMRKEQHIRIFRIGFH